MFSDADDDKTFQITKDRRHDVAENRYGDTLDLNIHALADGELSAEEEHRLMEKMLLSPALLDKLGNILMQNRIIRQNYPVFIKRNSH